VIEAATNAPARTGGLLYWSRECLVRVCEVVSAVLLLTLCSLLLAGIAARYVFHYPLTWSDDIVGFNFIWLTMTGSVVAYHRSQHLRMSSIVDQASPRWRRALQLATAIGEIVVFATLIGPGFQHAIDGFIIGSPVLDIPMFWRGLAVPVGCGLLLILALMKLPALPRDGAIIRAALTVLGFVALAVLGGMLAPVIGKLALIIFFVFILGGSILLGLPIAVAFLLATIAFTRFAGMSPMTIVASRAEAGLAGMLLLPIPGFILLGALMGITGMAKAMIDFLAAMVGHLRGGLSYVLILAMFLVSGISGSKSADMAAVAPPLFPEMRKRGVRLGEMVALLTATGIQTETIPPSLVLITIGSVTTVSIQGLFTGGLIPAIFLASVLIVVVYFRNRRGHAGIAPRVNWPSAGRLFVVSAPALVLPLLIRASVVEGVATATEVATIGVLYAVLLGFIVRFANTRLYIRDLWRTLVDAASLSGAIMFVIGGVTGMSFSLTQSGFSRQVAELSTSVPGGAVGFMAISMVLFIVLGAVLEGLPAMVLFAPLMFPAAAALGISEIHYAIVTVFCMGIGLFMPPFGVGYFIACAISNVDPREGVRPLMIYLAALLVGITIVAMCPMMTTILL
jgi:tripartite ATP-independent transporter DctM subunit